MCVKRAGCCDQQAEQKEKTYPPPVTASLFHNCPLSVLFALAAFFCGQKYKPFICNILQRWFCPGLFPAACRWAAALVPMGKDQAKGVFFTICRFCISLRRVQNIFSPCLFWRSKRYFQQWNELQNVAFQYFAAVALEWCVCTWYASLRLQSENVNQSPYCRMQQRHYLKFAGFPKPLHSGCVFVIVQPLCRQAVNFQRLAA